MLLRPGGHRSGPAAQRGALPSSGGGYSGGRAVRWLGGDYLGLDGAAADSWHRTGKDCQGLRPDRRPRRPQGSLQPLLRAAAEFMSQSLPEPPPSERRTPTLLEQMGGVGGLVSSAMPAVAFVAVNPLAGLQAAIWASLAVAVAVGVWRLIRREPLQPAVSGILGVAVCAFIAYRTGEARGFFLYGIWYSLVAGLVLALSVVVRRPLVGVLWSALNGSSFGWRTDRRARSGFDVATVVWAVFLLARFGVQHYLYNVQETDWLGVARLAMGLPLTAVAALVTIWAIRRAVRVTAATS